MTSMRGQELSTIRHGSLLGINPSVECPYANQFAAEVNT
jgi:hypothetical protein